MRLDDLAQKITDYNVHRFKRGSSKKLCEVCEATRATLWLEWEISFRDVFCESCFQAAGGDMREVT